MSSLQHHPAVADTTAAALRLHALVAAASEAQFSRSYVESDPTDPGIRSQGQHSDPTFDTVADERRQALRSAVSHAEQSLRLYQAAMDAASRELERALDAWGGMTADTPRE